MTHPPPPYRLETERLVIRCWSPGDAPLLKAAVDASLEHLRPWMPWAKQEPESLEAKAARIRRNRGMFDLDQDYVYAIFDAAEKEVVGGTGLHTRLGPGASEIGYWISAARAGAGLATESSAALVRAAFEVQKVERVEIHCAPDNARSASVARKLGFRHEATLRRRAVSPATGAPRDTMIWTLFADEYPGSPCAAARVRGYDAAGERVL